MSAERETAIVARYRLWGGWRTDNYAYKHRKGARLAEILAASGGYPSLAVEMGVGPGGVALELSQHGVTVIGFDLSPDALQHAQAHCRGTSVHLMRASGFALPFADRSLELVYASQVLHLFDADGKLALMAEVARVLRPGGRFVFDIKNRLSHLTRSLTNSRERNRKNFTSAPVLYGLLLDSGYGKIARHAGVMPAGRWGSVPAWCRLLAHTTFYVATRR